MQKVWFGRIWVMTGRWSLWSLSEPVKRPSVVTRAWFRQVYAPYWHGDGVALTAGPWSLRFGLCRPGLEVAGEPDDDEFYWGEFGPSFDQHLEASLFEPGPIDNVDENIGQLCETEAVTLFIDPRTAKMIAMVHEDGDVEYVKPVGRDQDDVPSWAGS